MNDNLQPGIFSTFTRNETAYVAVLEVDEFTHPEEYDCYSEEEIDAFNSDNWHFYEIIIMTVREGKEKIIGSLCGIDGPSSEKYVNEIIENILEENL